MKGRNGFCFDVLVAFFSFSIFSQMVFAGFASDNRDIEFEVIDCGDLSGFAEEAYFVVESEAEWESLWQRHAIVFLPPKPCPRIAFSEKMIICAFMGRQPTDGYQIQLRRIWSSEGMVHVEILETSPSEDLILNPVSASPFVFASIERTDWEIIFDVEEEIHTINDNITPEFHSVGLTLAMLILLSVITVLFSRKKMR